MEGAGTALSRFELKMSMQTQLQSTLIGLTIIALCTICPGISSGVSWAQSDNRNQAGGLTQEEDDDLFKLPEVPQLPAGDPQQQQTPQAAQPPRVEVMVNEKFAGWQQASDRTLGRSIDDSIRSNWVMADETGRVGGVVYGTEGADLGGLKIYLLRNGKEETNVVPNDEGQFSFPNVRPGVYSLVGWGDNAFFAFSFNLLPYNPDINENVPTELKVTASPNETTINTDWIQFFAKKVRFPIYGVHKTGEAAEDTPALYGLLGQYTHMPPSRPATSISSHQVIPTSDGRVIGRVHQVTSRNGRPVELRNTRVMLLKDDDVYAAVTTDSFGVFEFPQVPPGEYNCVAVGQDGMGSIGIFLGEPASDEEGEETEFAPIDMTMMTSEATGWLNSLAIETAYQRIISRPQVNFDEEPCPSYQPPGCCPEYKLRPGGYRPPPRSAIPRDELPLRKLNRIVDGLFSRF
jgi:hypothetical protein